VRIHSRLSAISGALAIVGCFRGMHINLCTGFKNGPRRDSGLRREIGAILGNAGVRPRAMGLISLRGFCSEAP
jgi:hypothetical protein